MSSGIVFDASVEPSSPASGGSPPSSVIAKPITELIGRRVRALRSAARYSGAQLATELNKHGINWNRTTVAKLETGRRASVTVEELLALALVLNVPPIWLLGSPDDNGLVPLTENSAIESWPALAWMGGHPGGQAVANAFLAGGTQLWGATSQALSLGLAAQNAILTLLSAKQARERGIQITPIEQDGAAKIAANEVDAVVDSEYLNQLSRILPRMRELNLATPEMPAYVRDRAEQLGIDLDRREV